MSLIKKIFAILLDIFPNVLADEILEYVGGETIIQYTRAYNRASAIKDDKIYTFNFETKKMHICDVVDNIYFNPQCVMSVDDIEKIIYAIHKQIIYIFDEECNEIRQIHITDPNYSYSEIAVVKNKICMYETYSVKHLVIYNMNSPNESITVKFMSSIFGVQAVIGNFLVLDKHEIIELSTGGEILSTISIDDRVHAFYVIEDEIYMIYDDCVIIFDYDTNKKYLYRDNNHKRIINDSTLCKIISHDVDSIYFSDTSYGAFNCKMHIHSRKKKLIYHTY